MNFVDKLREKFGEPQSFGAMSRYIRDHAGEIKDALALGYTKRQVMELIAAEAKCKVGHTATLDKYIRKAEKKAAMVCNSGFLVEYYIGTELCREWKRAANEAEIKTHVKKLGEKAAIREGCNMDTKIIKIKRMSYEEYCKGG